MLIKTKRTYTQQEFDSILASADNGTFISAILDTGKEVNSFKDYQGNIQPSVSDESIINVADEASRLAIVSPQNVIYKQVDNASYWLYDGASWNRVVTGDVTLPIYTIKSTGDVSVFAVNHNDFVQVDDSNTHSDISLDLTSLGTGESFIIMNARTGSLDLRKINLKSNFVNTNDTGNFLIYPGQVARFIKINATDLVLISQTDKEYAYRSTDGAFEQGADVQTFATNETIDVSQMYIGRDYDFIATADINLIFINGTLINYTSAGTANNQLMFNGGSLTFKRIDANTVKVKYQ